jgi:hypothetical protein
MVSVSSFLPTETMVEPVTQIYLLQSGLIDLSVNDTKSCKDLV